MSVQQAILHQAQDISPGGHFGADKTYFHMTDQYFLKMICCITRKHFRAGRVATSEWMRSIRVVRDTLAADCSEPGVNTTRRIPYRPPIVVPPFLLALSVCYFTTNSLAMWPTVTIRQNGFRGYALASGLQCDW